MNKKKKISIKLQMVGLILVCWFLPFLLIAGMTGYYMTGNHFENQIASQTETLDFNNQVSTERLNYAIDLSKAVTYEGDINGAYEAFRQNNMTMDQLLQICNARMYTLYNHEPGVQSAVLWMYQGPTVYSVNTYNESVGGTYRQVKDYWDKDHEKIYEIADHLDTKVHFYAAEGRFYLIRNLMDRSFHKIAALVIRLDKEYCFGNLMAQAENMDVTVQIDETTIALQGEPLKWKDVMGGERKGVKGYYWWRDNLGMYQMEREEDYTMTTMALMKDTTALTPFYGYRFVLGSMLILLLPMMFLLLKLFQRYFSRPIEVLMKGADEIEKGNLGYQMEEAPETVEFTYLTESFNEMSQQLKYQFDHIYEEEIALRDARIMALQSHINPHFMNNTLEIINWEARMNGDEKVSEMIGALSTLMDASIDRKKEPEVLLSEEMLYVNAYLRILKERLGKRLQVIDELPKEIMDCKVPRLILQPIIENAVEHGAVRKGTGKVILQGCREEEYLYLDIYNDGGMTKEEEEKVKRLLAPDYDTSKESSGNLGIANVNQRLRILYGEPCGLTIQNVGDGQVLTRLTIRV